jgi:hypothetical protein
MDSPRAAALQPRVRPNSPVFLSRAASGTVPGAVLKALGVEVVTIGQCLRPSLKNWPVSRYVDAASHAHFVDEGTALGLRKVFAGPFVRSSYHAKETHASI